MPKPKKQFDVVIMNPPYQSSATGGGQKGTRTHIWDKFVELSFQLSKEGGTVCNVHPSGWRRGSGKFSKVGQLLRSKQIHSLVLGNVDSGVKTFGVSTGFDWYVLKNSPVDQQAEVTDCNGVVTSLDLSKFDALPDSQIERITGLMAKNSEPRVQFIFDRSAYGHDKPWVQKEKTRKFRHPVVYSLPQKGAQIWFSSKGGSGHFGVPKVIWSNGAATQILVDKSGEYGMTEWAYAIADKPSNLPRIKKAMESAEFLELCKGIQFSLDRYDSKFISLFRADFWKEFV